MHGIVQLVTLALAFSCVCDLYQYVEMVDEYQCAVYNRNIDT